MRGSSYIDRAQRYAGREAAGRLTLYWMDQA